MNMNKYVTPGEVKKKAPRIQRGKEGLKGHLALEGHLDPTHSAEMCTTYQRPPRSQRHPHSLLSYLQQVWLGWGCRGLSPGCCKIKRKILYCKSKLSLNAHCLTPSKFFQVSDLRNVTLNSISTFPLHFHLCRTPTQSLREIW